MDSPEDPVAVIRRFYAEQVRRKGALDPDLCAPDYTAHVAGFPPMDRDTHSRSSREFWDAFPDLTIAIDEAFAAGDRVAFRFTARGTHRGPYLGVAPTGNRVEITGIGMARLAEGRVETVHELYDRLGVRQQIGAIPGSGS